MSVAEQQYLNFNPRPPCGGRHRPQGHDRTQTSISIHVLRVEDDLDALSKIPPFDKFQSTSSVWRTTPGVQPLATPPRYFNPRPPCGGRPLFRGGLPKNKGFQSTSSVWRTTEAMVFESASVSISIHVLRVEDDPRHRDAYSRARRISIHVLRVEDDQKRRPCG